MAVRRGEEVGQIPVRISYSFIRLFSEVLHRTPYKAVEELVLNSYDADAKNVRIVLPRMVTEESGHSESPDSLWVVDDGCGMDESGFRDLWSVAVSRKSLAAKSVNNRPLIGQFGIGKLAAYVLAWKLTHISRVNSKFLLAEMDFRDVEQARQKDRPSVVKLSLREVERVVAMELLAEIEQRDRNTWDLLFGNDDPTSTWTAAGLSEFKDLYQRLTPESLRWVLSDVLPLYSGFSVRIDGRTVQPRKETIPSIKRICLGSEEDTAATDLGFSVHKNIDSWVEVPGIGRVSGHAEIFEKSLVGSRSKLLGRSHGFFIRVRGRVINLEDEFFGLAPQNHSAWSRFTLEMHADGLHDHLLSSRRGVKDSRSLDQLREYLEKLFNLCRESFDNWNQKGYNGLGLTQLMVDSPGTLITKPLLGTLRQTIKMGNDSFYMKTPCTAPEADCAGWLSSNEEQFRKTPFRNAEFQKEGLHAPVLRYIPEGQTLHVNSDHPFVDKLTEGGKRADVAALFGSSELLLAGQLSDHGLSTETISGLLRDRDRVLRLVAGEPLPTATQVLRQLRDAKKDWVALKRAIGMTFQVLGFEYQRNSGNASGSEGVLYARFGRREKSMADYRLVYDAKQSNRSAVAADKIDLAALDSFRSAENADYEFFVARAYDGELNPESTLNRKLYSMDQGRITLLKIEYLDELVRLHYRYGVTLAALRMIFKRARTVMDVDSSLNALRTDLEQHEIPLRTLLDGLEEGKRDLLAAPNYRVVRARNDSLKVFEPDQLGASLKRVESILGNRWLEVDEMRGEVIMYQSPDETIEALKDKMTCLELVD